MNRILLFLFFTINLSCFSQQIHYYSDNFHGGVTGEGYNPGLSPSNSSIQFNLPNNVNIRKSFLFASSTKYLIGNDFLDSITININGVNRSEERRVGKE